MPKNTATGVILAGLATAVGFGLIWYMWWLAAAGMVALIGLAIAHSFNEDRDFHIPAEAVVEAEGARTELLRTAA
jgi:cytochrome o ubiquinol oxidase subunit 1